MKIGSYQNMYSQPPLGAQDASNGPVNGQQGGGQNQNFNMGGFTMNNEQADMMLNYGLSQGQNMFNQQKEKWMPGVSGFWDSLKIYFAVNNSYVSKKLFMILYPLSVTNPQAWARKSGEEGYDNGELRNKYALPKVSQSTNRYQYFMRRTAKQTLTNLLYSSLHYSSLFCPCHPTSSTASVYMCGSGAVCGALSRQ